MDAAHLPRTKPAESDFLPSRLPRGLLRALHGEGHANPGLDLIRLPGGPIMRAGSNPTGGSRWQHLAAKGLTDLR
jgi:hypothetical protein